MEKYRGFFNGLFRLDVGCFFYIKYFSSGAFLEIGSHVDMQKLALEKQGYEDSCFMTKHSNFHSRGVFTKTVKGTKHHEWRRSLEEIFDINIAFAFTDKLPNYSQLVGWEFYAPKEEKNPVEIQNIILMDCVNNSREIKACFEQLKKEIFPIIENKDLYLVNLKDIKKENYETQKFIVDDNKNEVKKSLLSAGIIEEKDLMLNSISFTPQERKVLDHYLHGMSAKEIGQKIDRSYKTIEEHINFIKAKLNVKRKREVFELVNKMKILGFLL